MSEKTELLEKARILSEQKKRLFGNVDIESPMSEEEKRLTKEIAAIYSEINQIVMMSRAELDGQK